MRLFKHPLRRIIFLDGAFLIVEVNIHHTGDAPRSIAIGSAGSIASNSYAFVVP
jgi:hypothetical protein